MDEEIDDIDSDTDHGTDVGVSTRSEVRHKTAKPRMYRVIMHNDDYTIMEFVISVLVKIFQKSPEEATRVMLQIHQDGRGTAGVYTYDIARTKAQAVHKEAQIHEYPLRCTVDKE